MKKRLAYVGIVLLSTTASACGDNGGSDSPSQPAWQAAIAACNSFCDAQTSCGLYPSADLCKETECDQNSLMLAPAECQEASKAYYECLNGFSNVCALDMCSEQFETAINLC